MTSCTTKVLICDDTVVTGSYNFSANAEKNAENRLRITDPEIAGRYADYITRIAQAYSASSRFTVGWRRTGIDHIQ